MKIITDANTLFKTVFGKQTITKEFKIASYCLFFYCDEGMLLFNNLSKELLYLSDKEAKCFVDENFCDDEIFKYLFENWFLVDKNIDSKKLCEQFLNTIKMLGHSRDNNYYSRFTIMTTLECNARCFYCFQKEKQHPRMSINVAKDIAEYILMTSKKDEDLSLSWFGGEPLYNYEVIDTITSKIHLARRKFKSFMTTNGFLFDDKIIEKAKKNWNLKSVQITLDGTEETYNRTKNYIYKDNISPFLRVINNIEKLLANDIKVNVRLNIGLHNIEDLYKLVDFLSERFKDNMNISVYAHRLYEYDKNGNQIYNYEKTIHLIEEHQKFTAHIERSGLRRSGGINSKKYRILHCMADSDNAVVITPRGDLTKCEHYFDSEIFGNIYSGIINEKLVNQWKERQSDIKLCEDCPVYPSCIRLKKCPDISEKCDILQKNEAIFSLKEKILNTYKKSLKL